MTSTIPAEEIEIPAGHLFTGIDYVPITAAELAVKTARIKRGLGRAFSELLEILDRSEWKADPRYSSWDDYCKTNFEFSGRAGYQKCAAQRVNNTLIEHKLPPVRERLARVVSDLPPAVQIEVIETAKVLSDSKLRSGKAAQYHTPGKISSRIVEEARRQICPDSPTPRDADLTPPIPPRPPLARPPASQPVTVHHASVDPLNKFGRIYHFQIDGRWYNLRVSANDFADFFSDDVEAPEESDPFA